MRLSILTALTSVVCFAASYTAEAVEAGRVHFLDACSACHGTNGEGGRGSNLVDGREVRRADDDQLFNSIQQGVPEADMPPFPFPDEQVWNLVAFIRSLSAPAVESNVEGDVAAGEAVFFGAGGCVDCHRIRGRGGLLGPDLSVIGSGRRIDQIRESLLDPNARITRGFEAATLDGNVRAVVKNHTNFSAQVLDSSGRLHLLRGDELNRLRFETKSWMPRDAATRLADDQVRDLVAFLSRQTSRQMRLLLCALVLSPLAIGQIDEAAILEGAGDDWLTYSGDYASLRHSSLDQINRDNVGSLVAKWVYHVPGARRLETTPLVYDGVMYLTNTNELHALDAGTGRKIWSYSAEAPRRAQNRGAALWGDAVFFLAADCHLVKLDRLTGALIWESEYASYEEGYYTSLAPLIVKGKVLVGTAGGGTGQRGFVAALSTDTGEELWRFWTVPAEGEPGSETWGGFPSKWGGAPTWTTGSYDPELNLIYWPTGNPWPDFYGGRRRGDNLYSNSVVALDADTGEMKWYFQFTPHDTHDWDANEQLVLVDREYKGEMRKLMLHADRNGFYYLLDRETGEYLQATRFVERLDWATGIDENGRPIEVPGLEPTAAGVKVCPSVRGATNWMSPSINPEIGLLYVVTLEMCDIYTGSAKEPVPSSGFRGGGSRQIPSEPGQFYLRALDSLTGEIRWEYKMTGPATMWAGTVSTAGDLVFTGDDDGALVALDARTGEALWHFPMGNTLYASPMTFTADGKQYVTIATATDVFTFGLFGD